ncbi:MAG: VTT domain-containing protein [Eubacteriales bacterium]|nr:VTT domain-containing protein [Eubacteriales bacterium]
MKGARLTPVWVKRIRQMAALPVLVAILFLGWEATRIPWQNLDGYLPASPGFAALAILGLYGLKSIFFVIPLYALYIVSSILFPPVWAIGITYLGLTIELLIGFWFGRRMGETQIRPRIEKYDFSNWLFTFIEKHAGWSCIVIRFLPLPADVSNMLLAASRISLPSYLMFSLVGFTPKLLSIILAGEAATNAHAGQFSALFTLIIVLEVSPMILIWLRRKYHK